jgi:hypothetical protein
LATPWPFLIYATVLGLTDAKPLSYATFPLSYGTVLGLTDAKPLSYALFLLSYATVLGLTDAIITYNA